ncbi:MAG: glutaredoxin domain-containing protein [bacterium]|nr:glutaredoxin domain-containing protein [bacterium]
MAKRQVEVFIAGCPLCEQAVRLVRELACPECAVQVHDLRQEGEARRRAAVLGIHRLPAVAVDGRPAGCCSGQGPVTREDLQAAGLGG